MSTSEQVIAISVMDRTYAIKCPLSSVTELQESAKYLDAEMRKINQSRASHNTESLAVVAALNIVHELRAYKNQKNGCMDAMHEKIKTLQDRIQKFLETKEEVAV